MFSYLKLCIITTPWRQISLTKAVILSSTQNFFATIATHCNNMTLQVKNTTIVYVFCLHSHTVTDLSGNKCFLQQVQKVTSLGCNWLHLLSCWSGGGEFVRKPLLRGGAFVNSSKSS